MKNNECSRSENRPLHFRFDQNIAVINIFLSNLNLYIIGGFSISSKSKSPYNCKFAKIFQNAQLQYKPQFLIE